MKAVLLSCLISVMSASLAHAQEKHPKLPLTEAWYQLEDLNKDGYTTVRRYSLIIDTPELENPIRNTLIFNCATKAHDISFITFIIPKEMSLTKMYGKNHVVVKKFNLILTSKSEASESFTIVGEVKENEIFFDFLGKNKDALVSLLDAKNITLLLDGEEKPIEFLILDQKFQLPIDGKNVQYDDFVRAMIDRSGRFTRQFQSEYLSENCLDLKKWKIENETLQNAN